MEEEKEQEAGQEKADDWSTLAARGDLAETGAELGQVLSLPLAGHG